MADRTQPNQDSPHFFSGGLTTGSAGAKIGLMGHQNERTLGADCRLARPPAAAPARRASTATYTHPTNRIAEKAVKRIQNVEVVRAIMLGPHPIQLQRYLNF